MGTVSWRGPANQLIEMPDSPVYDLGKDPSCTRTYMGPHALALASALPRGTIGTGDMSGWLVMKSNVARVRGAIGKLQVIYGASSAASGQQLPPDEMSIKAFEVNPPLERNNRYSSLVDADFARVDACIRAFQKDGTTPFALAGMLQDLFNKKKRGTTNYYLAGFRYSWTRHNYGMYGIVNVGGYLNAPIGPLASFIPGTFSCLRQADDLEWTGALFKYTMSWLCGPAGHFDVDLY